MYVIGNPINYNDPSGKQEDSGYNMDNSIGNPRSDSSVDNQTSTDTSSVDSNSTGTGNIEGPALDNNSSDDSPGNSHGNNGHGGERSS